MAAETLVVSSPNIPGYMLLRTSPSPGGFGDIYPAEQVSVPGRKVCCKVLGCRQVEREFALQSGATLPDSDKHDDSFEQEAAITASLRSRYVPFVLDAVEAKVSISDPGGAVIASAYPVPCFVMEWIEGPRLDEVVASVGRQEGAGGSGLPGWFGKLPLIEQARLLTVLEEIAHALQDAHRQQIAHFDLTPRNVMLAQGREVKLIDWGLARRLGPTAPHQREAPSKGRGSPDYMAPEQVPGSSVEDVGFPADVYALGGIGYLLLTGQAPRESTAEGDAKVRELWDQARSPEHHANLCRKLEQSGAPEFWVRLLQRCLSLDPNGRPVTAVQVVKEIEDYQASEQQRVVEAEKQRAAAEAEKKRLRVTAWAAVIVTALVLMLGGAVYVANTFSRKAEDESRRAEEALRQKELQAERAENEARLKRLAVVAHERERQHQVLTAAAVEWFKGNRDKARKMTAKAVDALQRIINDDADEHLSRSLLADAVNTQGLMAVSPASAKAFDDPPQADIVTATLFKRPLRQDMRQAFEHALACCERAAPHYAHLQAHWQHPLETLQRGTVINQRFHVYCLVSLQRFTEAHRIASEKKVHNPAALWALLLAAEGEQAELPWSRPPHADHAKAIRLADYIASVSGASQTAIYNAACAHALALNAPLSTPEEKARRAEKSLEYLQRVADLGYFRNAVYFQRLRKDDRDLDGLRERAEFKLLLRKLGGKELGW